MTVTELLERILALYPGANPGAIAAMKPVFMARLRHREAKLEDAANEVFASFQPRRDKPFPIPADFEAHLPSIHAAARDEKDAPIRQWLEQRAQRSESLFRDWHANQGAKIKAARPLPVYGQCVMLAKDLANKATEQTPRIVLTAEQIADCDQRAVSHARVGKFGALPKSEEAWREQIAQIRAEWAQPIQQAAE